MSLVQQVARVNTDMERHGRVGEFMTGLKYLMLNPRGGADLVAEKERAPSKVVDFVRAAVTPGATFAGSWGEQLAQFQNLPQAFLSSLSGVSVFDTLLRDMLVVPPRTHVVITGTVLTSSPISEASIKPASALSLTAADLDPKKAAAFVTVSEELLRMGVPSALTTVQRALREKMTRACNSIFITALAGVTSLASSGIGAVGTRQDIRALLANVTSGSEARLYLITTRTICEALSILPDTAGAAAFPQMQYNGGSIAGIPVIACDEMTDGEILLVDATQVAAASDALKFDFSREASIQMDDVGDSPPSASTNFLSLWQLNWAAVKVERYIAVKLLRSTAAARITGASFVGGSPA